ncbi:hypothetical protein N7494_008115 [Penicillium frequentans]|uniref:Exonuclease domain-containing protein n=1 Tax=Penicillium frequentans TaxID=3151616 RepID=A0AAD6CTT5_9EURO|nr:hypothetical protein N7494_008115 [Penicillium glabrum]
MLFNKKAARRRRDIKKRGVDTVTNDADPWVADPDTWRNEPDRWVDQSNPDLWLDLSASSTSTPAPSGSAAFVMQHAPNTSTNLLALGSITYPSSPVIKPASLSPRNQVLLDDLISKCHPASVLLAHRFTIPCNGTAKRKVTTKKSIPLGDLDTLPIASRAHPKREAIVMDCEMVSLSGGRPELAFVTALDFLTGEILINHYVQPRGEVISWNTRYSGVTRQAMNEAMRTGKGLRWEEARDRLRNFADSDTVLIGHALYNDLNVLRFTHLRIVDSSILTCDAVFPDHPVEKSVPRIWGLKTLTKELLGYAIQGSKLGHCALEDTRATRELVMLCLEDPKKVQHWGIKTRELEEWLREERERKQEENRKAREEEAAKLRAETEEKERRERE